MTRKDYVLIAEALSVTFPDAGRWDETTAEAFKDLTDRLATIFKMDNANFDRARFLEACGVK